MKTIYSDEYRMLTNWLIEKRSDLNLTQVELAERLGKPQSYISKYENGERRLDVVEFVKVTKVLEVDPCEVIKLLISKG